MQPALNPVSQQRAQRLPAANAGGEPVGITNAARSQIYRQRPRVLMRFVPGAQYSRGRGVVH